jgi:hypothetical protein
MQTISPTLRCEASHVLDLEGQIVEAAREVMRIMAVAGIYAAIVGGLAVVPKGYGRTTADVDIAAHSPVRPSQERHTVP